MEFLENVNFETEEELAKGDERKPGKPKGNLGSGEMCVCGGWWWWWWLWLRSVILMKKAKSSVKRNFKRKQVIDTIHAVEELIEIRTEHIFCI